ncbi:hypothetical protein HanIR_Chr02g0061101 [Helianthus annuus]|nr:hypothetical protein HanIR_Chr02g0061101 [Helianthus annuus]
MVGKTSTTVVVSAIQIPGAETTTRSSANSSSAIAAKFGANSAGGICVELLDYSDSEEDDSVTDFVVIEVPGMRWWWQDVVVRVLGLGIEEDDVYMQYFGFI